LYEAFLHHIGTLECHSDLKTYIYRYLWMAYVMMTLSILDSFLLKNWCIGCWPLLWLFLSTNTYCVKNTHVLTILKTTMFWQSFGAKYFQNNCIGPRTYELYKWG
jgi:hypothetical protein